MGDRRDEDNATPDEPVTQRQEPPDAPRRIVWWRLSRLPLLTVLAIWAACLLIGGGLGLIRWARKEWAARQVEQARHLLDSPTPAGVDAAKAGRLLKSASDVEGMKSTAAWEAESLASRGRAALENGSYSGTAGLLEAAATASPTAETYHELAWARFHAGQLEQAEADARRSLELEPRLDLARFLLLRIQAARGDRAGAPAGMRRLRAQSQDPMTDAAVRYCLGEWPQLTSDAPDYRFVMQPIFQVAIRGFTPASPAGSGPVDTDAKVKPLDTDAKATSIGT